MSVFIPEFEPCEQGARHCRKEEEERRAQGHGCGTLSCPLQLCDLLQTVGLSEPQLSPCEMGTVVLPCSELVRLGETIHEETRLRADDVLGEPCLVLSSLHFPLPLGEGWWNLSRI